MASWVSLLVTLFKPLMSQNSIQFAHLYIISQGRCSTALKNAKSTILNQLKQEPNEVKTTLKEFIFQRRIHYSFAFVYRLEFRSCHFGFGLVKKAWKMCRKVVFDGCKARLPTRHKWLIFCNLLRFISFNASSLHNYRLDNIFFTKKNKNSTYLKVN